MASLVAQHRPDICFEWEDEKSVFSADDSPVTVGRLNRCDITVVSPLVSREHLLFAWDGTKWVVTDTSANGVFDENQMARQWDLESERQIRLGAANGPYLSIAPVDNHTDGSAAPKSGTRSDRESTSIVLARSTVTQPIENTQLRLGLSSLAVGSQERSSSLEPVNVEPQDADESFGTGRIIGEASNVPSVDNAELTKDDSDPATWSASPTGSLAIQVVDEIYLGDPQATGELSGQTDHLDRLAQVTGTHSDSLAANVRAASIVIGSAVVAFVLWALISLLV